MPTLDWIGKKAVLNHHNEVPFHLLREGWDCPFAYVLCSVAQSKSITAVEQILGRILRLPESQTPLEIHPEICFTYPRDAYPNNTLYLRLIRHKSTRVIAKQLKAPDSSPASTAQFALAAYKPEAYPGKVVLFKASQREWYVDWDPMAAWKEFTCGELEIRTIAGEHNNLIKNPYVIELARQLKEVLE
jgi:superfamily II DNA or RNA helicase